MADVVAAISMSHAPGILGWPETAAADVRARMFHAIELTAGYLDRARPDVVVAFLDDHFENIYRNLSPTFAIGVADAHRGPPDYFLQALRLERPLSVPSNRRLAQAILEHTVHAGFDVARMGEIEYGNNLIAPWVLIRPQNDIPVVPIFINAYNPPLPTMARAFDFGLAVRAVIDAAPESLRVAFLATGGLSHWPPIWLEHVEYDPSLRPFVERMKRYQHEGRAYLQEDPTLMIDLGACEQQMARVMQRPLINPVWDRTFLAAVERGDDAFVRSLSYAEIEAQAGFGGHEVLNWAAGMGAMRAARATILNYEPVPEWICGMGFAIYGEP